jgi:hypothetical protein
VLFIIRKKDFKSIFQLRVNRITKLFTVLFVSIAWQNLANSTLSNLSTALVASTTVISRWTSNEQGNKFDICPTSVDVTFIVKEESKGKEKRECKNGRVSQE